MAQQVVCPAGAELRGGEVAGRGAAHRRDVNEVEGVGFLDVQQLVVVRELLEGAIGVQQRVARGRPISVARFVMELLHHRDERGQPGAGSHHQDVLEPGGALREREVADDPFDIRQAIVRVRLDTPEERFGEPPQHAVPSALEDHVELEVVPLRRLERRRGDRVGVRDRSPLLLSLGVEVGHVVHLVPVLHLSSEQAIVAAERDVLARLVGRELRAVHGDHAEQGEARRKPVPLDDAPGLELGHGSPSKPRQSSGPPRSSRAQSKRRRHARIR